MEFYKHTEGKMASAAQESELQRQAAEDAEAMLTGMFGSLGIAGSPSSPDEGCRRPAGVRLPEPSVHVGVSASGIIGSRSRATPTR